MGTQQARSFSSPAMGASGRTKGLRSPGHFCSWPPVCAPTKHHVATVNDFVVKGRNHVLRSLQTDTISVSKGYSWPGTDEYEELNDRKDEPPLPLPVISTKKRIVLVRHGQSTWNAAGIIQGSSNISELTPKGISQAEVSGEMLRDETFDKLYVSPLTRATQTAEIIRERQGILGRYPVEVLPELREVDLYDFQGLVKAEGKDRFGDEFLKWQKAPHNFELSGRAPVRELWHRGSLAWHKILTGPDEESSIVVVAHNAVNQALICTALGLGPEKFRRLLQSNAAYSVLEFTPSPDGGPPTVVLQRLNQSPEAPFKAGAGRASSASILLLRHASTDGNEAGLVMGSRDEPCSETGCAQIGRISTMLDGVEVGAAFSCPTTQCVGTSEGIAGEKRGSIRTLEDLRNRELGAWEGQEWSEVKTGELPDGMEPMWQFWPRVARAWAALKAAAGEGGGQRVVAVTHSPVLTAILCQCLGMDPADTAKLRIDTGGLTVVEFPDGVDGPPVLRCINYTAHLGDHWVVPAFGDDIDGVCGVDGCF